MAKHIRTIMDNNRFVLSEFSNGFWIFDKEGGTNLATQEKSEQQALVAAINMLIFERDMLKGQVAALQHFKSTTEQFMESLGWKEIDQSEEDFLSSYR